MNWLSLLPTLLKLAASAPAIIAAWESSPVGGMDAVQKVVERSGLAEILAEAGSQLFPKLSPTLHAAAAALALAHPNNTSWAQSALNFLQQTGFIAFGTPLRVDGFWGPKTMHAVLALQAKLGLPASGFIADAEYNAISALLAKA